MSGMTTIERLETTEQKTADYEKGLALIVSLSEQMTANAQRIEALEAALQQAAEMIMTLVAQDRDINGSIAGLAKTVGAVAEILEDREILTSEGLQKKKQDGEDREERRMIQSLVQMGVIEQQNDPVNADSLVILSRSELMTTNPEKSRVLSEYVIADLGSPATNSDLKQDLLGKQAGESVSYVKDSQAGIYSVLTIKEIYAHKEAKITGDEETPPSL
jgi:hypothetical protein